jgi:RNA polymerase sigma-70 factor (ECF subfamily)
MHYPKDAILIRKLKEGRRDAYEQAYRKYHHLLIPFAQKYVKSRSLAEDAVQDVYIKLWQVRGQLDEQKSLRGFLYTSLKNHILNSIRDSHQEIYEAYTPEVVKCRGRNEVEEKLIYQEYEGIVQEAMLQLSPKRRQVFEIKQSTDLSNEQIAEKLGVSVTTVKSQYYRGARIVKSYLKEHIEALKDVEQ